MFSRILVGSPFSFSSLTNMLIFLWLFLTIFRVALAVILVTLGFLISKKMHYMREFLSPFECGFRTLAEGRLPFSIRFFIITLIFLIFDLELVILFPGITSLTLLRFVGVIRFLTFLNALTLGLFLE